MKTAIVCLIFLLVAVPLAAAQSKPADLKYQLTTELKLKGTVDDVKSVPNCGLGGDTGIELTLKTDKGSIEVVVAPEAFLKDMEIKFDKGDKIELVASKVTKAEGGEVYLAREITQNGNSLTVRDEKGAPVWTWMAKKPS